MFCFWKKSQHWTLESPHLGPLSPRPLGHTFSKRMNPMAQISEGQASNDSASLTGKKIISSQDGAPQWCECWFINHEIIPMNTSSIMFVISTINPWFFFSHKNKPTVHAIQRARGPHSGRKSPEVSPPAMGFCRSLVGNCQISIHGVFHWGQLPEKTTRWTLRTRSNLNQKKNTWRIHGAGI